MFKSSSTSKVEINILALLILTISAVVCGALTNEADVKDIGVNEKLGDAIPLDLKFFDEDGNQIFLGDLLKDGKPLILSLAYFSCPKLCSLTLNGTLESINALSSLYLGRDFKLATLSFNPIEKPDIARKKAVKYRGKLKKEQSAEKKWLFLTGDEDNISKLTQAVGFKYKKDGEEFAHPTTLIFITPDGRISRYLYGVRFEPKEMKLSLLEASDGKIGSSEVLNKVLLFCYEFDPVGKRYALQALKIVKAGGVITLISLGLFLTYYWKKEKNSQSSDGGKQSLR
ncbi:MAG TPA: SCO family protein [Thermodesulfobacteriota bacterium]